MSENHYDVIIVGAGIVGLTLALALAQQNKKILVIDKHSLGVRWPYADYQLRVSALNRASHIIFQQLNVWPGIIAKRVCAYSRMQVWDATGSGNIIFNAADMAQPNLGFIGENQVLLDALQEALREYPQVQLRAPLDLQTIVRDAEKIAVSATDATFSAKLLVGADGAHSWVRQQLQLPLTEKSLGHHALIATIKTALPHAQTAYQVFRPTGPLALLPLADPHYCSIVWSLPAELAQAYQKNAAPEFNQALTEYSCARLGKLILQSERVIYPLYSRLVENSVQARVALIGDAAHTIHPLAGQGLNLGLRDVAVLAAHLRHATDCGERVHLQKFVEQTRLQQRVIQKSMEWLQQLFASENSGVGLLRNTGLNIVNQSTFLKNQFAKQALGVNTAVPRLF